MSEKVGARRSVCLPGEAAMSDAVTNGLRRVIKELEEELDWLKAHTAREPQEKLCRHCRLVKPHRMRVRTSPEPHCMECTTKFNRKRREEKGGEWVRMVMGNHERVWIPRRVHRWARFFEASWR